MSAYLDIFDDEAKYLELKKQGSRQRKGCNGLDFGGKPTVLDAMDISVAIWNNNDKYCTRECVQRCWRKADILPPSMTASIEQDVGSRHTDHAIKIEKEDLDDLVKSMSQLCSQTRQFAVVPAALEESFADKGNIECAIREGEAIDSSAMAAWVLAEDDQVVIEVEITEAFENSQLIIEDEESEVEESVSIPREAVVSHMDSDYHLRQVSTYICGSYHDFPDSIISKTETLLAEIRHFRSRQKRSSQKVMTSYFTTPSTATSTTTTTNADL